MATTALSAAEAIVVFADVQEGIINVGTTAEIERMRVAVDALADLATIFNLPVAITSVPTTGGTVAPVLAEITARHPGVVPIVRTTADAMNDPAFCAALAAAKRRTIVLAGVATEIAVRLAALSAQRAGYEVIVAVDACNGLDARTESATLMHLASVGITLSSVAAIAAELAGDFGSDTGRAAMRALQSTLGSHVHHDRTDAEHEHEHDHGAAPRRI